MKDVIDRPDLVDDPRFCTAVEAKKRTRELVEIISEGFAKYTQKEMAERLAKADIAFDYIRHVKDILTDAQALENQYVVPVKNLNHTETLQAMSPVRFCLEEPQRPKDIEPTVERDAPQIGEHTVEILKEYGYDDAAIQHIKDIGAISCEE